MAAWLCSGVTPMSWQTAPASFSSGMKQWPPPALWFSSKSTAASTRSGLSPWKPSFRASRSASAKEAP